MKLKPARLGRIVLSALHSDCRCQFGRLHHWMQQQRGIVSDLQHISPAILTSGIVPVPPATAERDRFFVVTSTTGTNSYAAGFTAVGDARRMAVAWFKSSGGLDTAFGSNGVAAVNVAGKKAELARSVVVPSDGRMVIAGPIGHDISASSDAA